VPSISIHHHQIALLFQNHQQAITAYLQHKVQCPDAAEDLSQEAYLRLLRKDALQHNDNLTGYLFKIAERLAIDFLRQHNRRSVELDEALECPNLQPEALLILREQCRLLLQAIASLPKQTRCVFLLRKIDELSYADIAQKLGISEKTVQRHLVKAMLHCHKRLHDALI
jgi:RNA polymerase sigma-70 factor (ECF subfamily)